MKREIPPFQKESISFLDEERGSFNLLQEELSRNQIESRQFIDIAFGLREIKTSPPDLVMVDPRIDGRCNLEIIQEIRSFEKLRNVPLVISSWSGQEETIVQGFELGCDEFLQKPFQVHEAVSRIRSLLRRKKMPMAVPEEEKIEFEDVVLYLNEKEVKKNGIASKLTRIETKILKTLVRHAGSALSRPYLITSVWSEDQIVEDQNLDVHISSIRKKIEDNSSRPKIVVTVRGYGYRFNLPTRF